jgi:uncharacterized damage-inducible protein DinB
VRNTPAAATLALSLNVAAIAVIAAVAAVATPACRQQPAVDSRVAHELLTSWYDLERKLLEMAEDFPEDRYGYKPTREVRSFSEILHHVTEENLVYVQTARGERVDRDALDRQHVNGRKELVEFLKKSFDEGAALIANTTDRDMLEQVTNPYGKRLTRLAFWLELVQHAAEHYGNLVSYYRLNDLVPPETRRMQQSSGQRPQR